MPSSSASVLRHRSLARRALARSPSSAWTAMRRRHPASLSGSMETACSAWLIATAISRLAAQTTAAASRAQPQVAGADRRFGGVQLGLDRRDAAAGLPGSYDVVFTFDVCTTLWTPSACYGRSGPACVLAAGTCASTSTAPIAQRATWGHWSPARRGRPLGVKQVRLAQLE